MNAKQIPKFIVSDSCNVFLAVTSLDRWSMTPTDICKKTWQVRGVSERPIEAETLILGNMHQDLLVG